MRICYADPPYLGCGAYYSKQHSNALIWNDPETYRAFIKRLHNEFPDGWAMSLSSPSLQIILPMCPKDIRVGAWVKPFCSFKPGVTIAYAWEPIVWRGGRKRIREQSTVRDWVSESITLKRGLTGVKPNNFCYWLFEIMNLQAGDILVDLFPGSGNVTTAWREWINR